MNAAPDTLYIEQLHPEHCSVERTARWLTMLAELKRMERALDDAHLVIDQLTVERDDLALAVRSWAHGIEVGS